MPYVYLLNASACPPILETGAAILISTGGASTPITTAAESLTPGETPLAGAGRLNRNFGRLDLLGRYGGGHAGAILWGLDLEEDTGLTISVTAGQAGIDSGAELAANATLALVDATVSRVWLSRGGSLNKVTAGAAEPLEPPDTAVPWAYLGACTMAAGALTEIDRSGVLTVGRGGLLFRRTGDAGAPDDTPPADVRLLTQTAGGLYLWTGEEYFQLGAVAAAVADTAGAPSAGYVQAEAAAVLAELRALKSALEAAGILTP